VYASAERNAWVDVGRQIESKRLGQPDAALAALYRTAPPAQSGQPGV
jgi:hypothetical protein